MSTSISFPGVTQMGGRRVEHCMGTVFSIDIRGGTVAKQAVDDVVSWLHWVDATFSTFRADSQLSCLARGEISRAECVPEIGQVLDRCASLERETAGYFSAYAAGVLDPSGLVKGWAIECASTMLRAAGSTAHCVNGGGDVQCVGAAAPGQPWRIGIAHPLHSGLLAGVVTGEDLAVATSGSAERGVHILDPHSRRGVAHFASVTVTGPSAEKADAYATAAYAMGPGAYEWIEQLQGYHGFIVELDSRTWCSSGWRMAGRSIGAAGK